MKHQNVGFFFHVARKPAEAQWLKGFKYGIAASFNHKLQMLIDRDGHFIRGRIPVIGQIHVHNSKASMALLVA